MSTDTQASSAPPSAPASASAPRLVVPGYRATLSVVCVVYVVLGGSMALSDPAKGMAGFGVPEVVLSSPHFVDFFHWVFVHMTVLGVLTGLLGWLVTDGRSQRVVLGVLTVLQLHYLYLDVRTSDSALGSGLYQGPRSLVPPLIGLVITLAYAVLCARGPRPSRGVPTSRRLASEAAPASDG